jgi:hypothetical protein
VPSDEYFIDSFILSFFFVVCMASVSPTPQVKIEFLVMIVTGHKIQNKLAKTHFLHSATPMPSLSGSLPLSNALHEMFNFDKFCERKPILMVLIL